MVSAEKCCFPATPRRSLTCYIQSGRHMKEWQQRSGPYWEAPGSINALIAFFHKYRMQDQAVVMKSVTCPWFAPHSWHQQKGDHCQFRHKPNHEFICKSHRNFKRNWFQVEDLEFHTSDFLLVFHAWRSRSQISYNLSVWEGGKTLAGGDKWFTINRIPSLCPIGSHSQYITFNTKLLLA